MAFESLDFFDLLILRGKDAYGDRDLRTVLSNQHRRVAIRELVDLGLEWSDGPITLHCPSCFRFIQRSRPDAPILSRLARV